MSDAETAVEDSLAPTPLPESRFAAQDLSFMKSYEFMASKSHYMVYADLHTDIAGGRFFESDEHMAALSRQGYEYVLLELPTDFNDIFKKFEAGHFMNADGTLNEDLLTRAVEDGLMEAFKNQNEEDPEKIFNGKEGAFKDQRDKNGYFDNSGGSRPGPAYLRDFIIETMKNGHEHGIKVRGIDTSDGLQEDSMLYQAFENLISPSANSHIMSDRLRVDRTWDKTIEDLTGGSKAALFVGGWHLASSFGIDEYLWGRGRGGITGVHISGSPHLKEVYDRYLSERLAEDPVHPAERPSMLSYVEKDHEQFRVRFAPIDTVLHEIEQLKNDPEFIRYTELAEKWGDFNGTVGDPDEIKEQTEYQGLYSKFHNTVAGSDLYPGLSEAIHIMPIEYADALYNRLEAIKVYFEGLPDADAHHSMISKMDRHLEQLKPLTSEDQDSVSVSVDLGDVEQEGLQVEHNFEGNTTISLNTGLDR